MEMSDLFKRRIKQQFKTQKKLERLIGEYLDKCDNEPTKIGLNNYLGISRQNVYDWSDRNNEKHNLFAYTIKKAYDIMEQQILKNMKGKNTLANMFLLKATFKYQDNHKPRTNETSGNAPVIKIGVTNEGDNKLC